MKEAPMPFMTMILPSWTGSVTWKAYRSRKNQMVMSSMPRPTTVKPMTEPEEKATRRPLFRLSEAAWAVRALELVAIFMPMRPASMDQIPPVTKANGVYLESIFPPEPNAMARRMTNTTANTFSTVVYCRFRYALAPSRMEAAIFCILSLPSEKDMTFFACMMAKRPAMTAPTKPIQNRLSNEFTPLDFLWVSAGDPLF